MQQAAPRPTKEQPGLHQQRVGRRAATSGIPLHRQADYTIPSRLCHPSQLGQGDVGPSPGPAVCDPCMPAPCSRTTCRSALASSCGAMSRRALPPKPSMTTKEPDTWPAAHSAAARAASSAVPQSGLGSGPAELPWLQAQAPGHKVQGPKRCFGLTYEQTHRQNIVPEQEASGGACLGLLSALEQKQKIHTTHKDLPLLQAQTLGPQGGPLLTGFKARLTSWERGLLSMTPGGSMTCASASPRGWSTTLPPWAACSQVASNAGSSQWPLQGRCSTAMLGSFRVKIL